MITINLDKARAVAHDERRAARAAAFAPLDDQIAKRIPGKSPDELEAERQAIRDADAETQKKIDKAKTVDALLAVVTEIKAP